MEAQSYTAEERRAANQVWAGGRSYGFEPLFLARNTDGTIDFYMNCVVGLVHKYYGDELVRSLFDAWEGDIRQAMLDDLTWLYLESAVYALELPRRPVLSALRRAHADYFFGIQYKLSRQEWMAKNQLVYSMQAARWRAVQGRTPPVMTPYEKDLDAALSPETAPEAGRAESRTAGRLRQIRAVQRHGASEGRAASPSGRPAGVAHDPHHAHSDDKDRPGHGGAFRLGGRLRQRHPRRQAAGPHHPAPARRGRPRYIESCFGRSLYPPERLQKAEQELCTGEHLAVTSGLPPASPARSRPLPPRQSTCRTGSASG